MSETALIPAKYADIFWNDDPALSHRAAGPEVLILDRSPGQPPRSRATDPTHLSCSNGAMISGWMQEDHPLRNPAGVFAHNWLAKGSSPEAVRAALREFAKIKECQWAREMLAVIDWRSQEISEG